MSFTVNPPQFLPNHYPYPPVNPNFQALSQQRSWKPTYLDQEKFTPATYVKVAQFYDHKCPSESKLKKEAQKPLTAMKHFINRGEEDQVVPYFAEHVGETYQNYSFISLLWKHSLSSKLVEDLLAQLEEKITDFADFELQLIYQGIVKGDHAEILEQICQARADTQLWLPFLLAEAVYHSAISCVQYLLPLSQQWKLTPFLALCWASQETGSPGFDACISQIASVMLPVADKNSVDHSQTSPYASQMTLDFLFRLPGKNDNFYQKACISYLTFTPFLFHCIATAQLAGKHYDTVLDSLQEAVEKLLLERSDSYTPSLDCLEPSAFFTRSLRLSGVTLDKVSEIFLALMEAVPALKSKQICRCLIAVFALLKKPKPEFLALAQALTEKTLVITCCNLPWFPSDHRLVKSVIGTNLMARWKERLPAGLEPGVSLSKFPQYYNWDPSEWLDGCKIVGPAPKHHLSAFSSALIQMPYDHPLFLRELGKGGVLYKERTLLVARLEQEKKDYRSHFMMVISTLKEDKTYEL